MLKCHESKTGVIVVYDYQIIQKGAYYYVKSKYKPVCASCNALLTVRGSKKRYLIMETGEKNVSGSDNFIAEIVIRRN